MILSIILALIINYFFGKVIHWIPYYLVVNAENSLKAKKQERKNFKFNHLNTKEKIIYTLLPDYYFALCYKVYIKNLNKECEFHSSGKCITDRDDICITEWDSIKIKVKYFIQFSNWLNVMITCIFGIITVLFWGYNGWIIDLGFYILIARVFSRFIEISFAFYKDVVRVDDKVFTESSGERNYIHRWRNSLILKSGRISLAIHSLIEVVILYSLVYYSISIYFFELNNDELIKLIGFKSEILTYLNFLFTSIAVTVMNFSYTNFPHIAWSIGHLSQVLLSMILIVLSLASYLGLNNNLSERDNDLYNRVQEKLKE
ncbi:hypothetical protein [Guptibacillus hwajinpoensis]|uniref:hypothetical protein n=1 Tax=Guptibacillus hwajinpoensis TaxID=208199 RepID=UPI003736DAFE